MSTLRFITQSLQRHLERVLALEEYDGYMDLVLHESPRLSNTVAALKLATSMITPVISETPAARAITAKATRTGWRRSWRR